MQNKTVKVLRQEAKALGVIGVWDMNKQQLIGAINGLNPKATEQIPDVGSQRSIDDYIDTLEAGSIIAFTKGDFTLSGKFVQKVSDNVMGQSVFSYEIVTLTGIRYFVHREDILWVKTGSRWPNWVFSRFKNNPRRVEQDGTN